MRCKVRAGAMLGTEQNNGVGVPVSRHTSIRLVIIATPLDLWRKTTPRKSKTVPPSLPLSPTFRPPFGLRTATINSSRDGATLVLYTPLIQFLSFVFICPTQAPSRDNLLYLNYRLAHRGDHHHHVRVNEHRMI
jgi:hypothetical protein